MSSFLFIDSRVQNIDALLAGIGWDFEVVLLDAEENGLPQIVRALEGVTDLDAIHIISHGAAGTLYLGASTLSEATLDDYQAELATIGSAALRDRGHSALRLQRGAGRGGRAFHRAAFRLHRRGGGRLHRLHGRAGAGGRLGAGSLNRRD